jgi:hypothetical protein
MSSPDPRGRFVAGQTDRRRSGLALAAASMSSLSSQTGLIVIRINVRKKIWLSLFATSVSVHSPGSIRINLAEKIAH